MLMVASKKLTMPVVSKRIADFTYTFNTGSTSGRDYEIEAVAFDSNSISGSDTYDLTVWSDMVDVAIKTNTKCLR